MTPEIDSPTGLDIHPRPPAAVRVRKGVGIALLFGAGIVTMAIVYGVYERQHRQVQAFFMEAERKATPATSAGLQITSQIPAGAAAVLKDDVPSLDEETETASNSAPASSVQTPRGPAPRFRSVPATPTGFSYQNGAERTENRDLDLARQKEQEAMEAPTRVGGGNTSVAYPNSPTPLANSNPLILNGPGASFPRVSVADAKTGFAGMSQTGEYNAQNGQDEKSAFIARARSRAPDNYLHSVRAAPLTKFEIKAGWDIPATLEQAINSDQPGELKALVRENVCDTATGKYVLVPQGSRLVGSYNSAISYGQDGVQVVWDRIIFPDASSLNLSGMIGQDAKGESGLRYGVDHHYARLLGFAVLTSLFSAGFQLSQNRPGTILATPSTGEIIGGAVGGQISQLGAETFRRQLNVQPTIKVPAGYRFNVRVNRDIVFDSPYSPFRQQN